MISSQDKPIIIYDGECRMCQSAVRFLKTKDDPVGFVFISSSGNQSDQLLHAHHISKELTNKSVILIEKDRVYIKSTAVIRAMQKRGGIWRLAGLLRIIPEFIRNLVYDLIAKYRKKL
jgi:predicted DCC family thiol-disulfide oxidoreductase YuxK